MYCEKLLLQHYGTGIAELQDHRSTQCFGISNDLNAQNRNKQIDRDIGIEAHFRTVTSQQTHVSTLRIADSVDNDHQEILMIKQAAATTEF